MSIEWDNAEAKNNKTNKQLIQHQQQKQKQERLSLTSLPSVIGQPVDFFSNDLAADRKIKLASSLGSNLSPSHQRLFLELPKDEDKVAIADFIIDSYNQQNISLNTKCAYVTTLVHLSRYLDHKKSFKDMTSQDVVEGFLNSYRRPLEADPDQRWINTFKTRAMVISKFFRWLAYPTLKHEERLRNPLPLALTGLRLPVKKGPKTHVKNADLWTLEDDAIFLKYCEDPRIACYHAMSRETSARPGELLAVKIGDVKIKRTGDGKKMYAEVEIGRYGKVKKIRTAPLINSLPYYKDWIAKHPMTAAAAASNPNAYLFVSYENSAKYRNAPLKASSLLGIYTTHLRKNHFPKLLERPDVPPEDKIKIRQLLRKPWNPYIRRHTGLHEKARLVNEHMLRQHAGWTKSSQMVEIYTHELGDESSQDLLLAYGIDVKNSNNKDKAIEQQALAKLQPVVCLNCSEPNKPGSKFCLSCKMVLSYDAYNETIEEAEENKKALEEAKKRLAEMEKWKKEFAKSIDVKLDFKIEERISALVNGKRITPKV